MRATVDELRAFLEINPDLEAVEAFITDACGVARGKLLRVAELEALYRAGRPLPGSMLSLDTTGMEVETALTANGDADFIAFPTSGTLRRVPWRGVPTAQLVLSTWSDPHPADPRHVLARVVALLRSANYIPVVAAELEFYLVARERGEPGPCSGARGQLRPARARSSSRGGVDPIDAFSISELDAFAPFFDELFAGARVMELPAATLISESAPGQFEVVLRHRDAMQAADDAVMWKRLVRAIAAKHGLLATFMAKPFGEHAGSGLHIHASLEDSSGGNLFASQDPAGSSLMRHAIGGLLAMLDDSMAIFAPNANSYRRFQAGSYAPISRTWGVDNRTVAVRVPTGAPETRHLEHRVAGADANPYLAIAAVLAGMHEGIVDQRDPGPASEGNQHLPPRSSDDVHSAPSLPSDWADALRRLRSSSLASYFGAQFLELYREIKVVECRRFHARVTELDLDWYLTRV